ncbi:phospholipid-binding protein MlaC [Rhodospirillum sp. A1_3_36]|uniref:MlaC/ttg2D family ABC transporter substrate-binding protein n=1 Tax=Rhodospirillum sp. A1_3_36 TaxID=3391666 RepID=UPI0039A44D5B
MALSLAFGAVTPSLAEDMPRDPSAFVQELSRYAIEDILKADVAADEKVKRFDKLLNTAFDLDFISRFVVGGYWKKASDAEQKEFQSLFRDLNVINWGSRFNEYGGQKITITNTNTRETRGGTIHEVTTNIGKEDDKPLQVIWVLRENDGKLGVIDLKVEGVSLALTFQSEYKAVLKNTGSMSGLNDVLRKKIEELRAKQG